MKNFFDVKNIIHGPLTTLIALVLVGVAGYSIVNTGTVDEKDIVLIGLALALLPAKDPKDPKATASILILLIGTVLLLTSCVTPQRCLDKFGGKAQTITVHDTVSVTVKAVLPADSLSGSIGLDSVSLLATGKIDSLKAISESKNLRIKFWYDRYLNALRYTASVKPDTVIVTKEIPVEVKGNCPPTVVVDPNQAHGWFGKVWLGFQIFSGYLVLGGLAVLLIVLLFKWFF